MPQKICEQSFFLRRYNQIETAGDQQHIDTLPKAGVFWPWRHHLHRVIQGADLGPHHGHARFQHCGCIGQLLAQHRSVVQQITVSVGHLLAQRRGVVQQVAVQPVYLGGHRRGRGAIPR